MKVKFNPSEYKSYEALPEEQKQNFEAIEGGKGFVLKTVEKNPETARRLAIAEDQAINTLKQEIETHNLSFEDLLSQYRVAVEKYNYQEEQKTSELLKQISDYNILRGGNYNEHLKKEFKKRYESLTYSEKTQSILIENLESTDLEVAAKLLLDKKFSLKTKLLKKIGNGDDIIRRLYELAGGDLGVVELIVETSKNPSLKVEILKSLSELISKTQDEKQRKKKLEDYSFDSIKKNVAETLVRNTDYNGVLRLIDEDFLAPRNLRGFFHKVESNQFLYNLASRSKDRKEITYLFKFITDKEIFSEIVDKNGQSFSKLSDSEKQEIVGLAKRFYGIFESKPEVYQAGDLQESNKFIVGIPDDEDKLFVAWSNTDRHEYHKDIFQTLSQQTGKRFPEHLRSGGWIELRKGTSNQVTAIFSRSSGDFGNYSHRVLEKFRETILKTLREKLGSEDVELEIKVSS